MDSYSRYWVFCEVVARGSFTRTAEAIGYSQSAVSQIVRSVEEELGTALIERRKDGIRLTRDGEDFLPFLQNLRNAEEALYRHRQELAGLENTTIRIGAFTSISRSFLPRLMVRFRERWPGVNFTILQGDYTTIPQWLQEGSVDFGFTCLDAESNCDSVLLYRDDLLAVLPAASPLAAQPEVSLAQLAEEPFILLDEGRYSTVLHAFADHGVELSPAYTISDDYTILSMVQQGLANSMLYRPDTSGSAGGVVVRPIREHPTRPVGLIFRYRSTLPLAARRFAEFIIRELGEE